MWELSVNEVNRMKTCKNCLSVIKKGKKCVYENYDNGFQKGVVYYCRDCGEGRIKNRKAEALYFYNSLLYRLFRKKK